MFGVSPAIIGLLRKLGEYLQAAIKRAALESAAGNRPDPEKIAEWLTDEMKDWDPKIKGRALADQATRQAAARFLSGIACNLITPSEFHERAA